MTLRMKIEATLRAAGGDPRRAAVAICRLLHGEVGLGHGWFDDDKDASTGGYWDKVREKINRALTQRLQAAGEAATPSTLQDAMDACIDAEYAFVCARLRMAEYQNLFVLLRELDPHRGACLYVLRLALLRARYALRTKQMSEAEQRTLGELMDAIHNLPVAAQGDAFWDAQRVSAMLAGYDARCETTAVRDHFWPTKGEKLGELYSEAFEALASKSAQRSSTQTAGADRGVAQSSAGSGDHWDEVVARISRALTLRLQATDEDVTSSTLVAALDACTDAEFDGLDPERLGIRPEERDSLRVLVRAQLVDDARRIDGVL